MYFLRGCLPWQGLKATTKKQKYEKILEKKMSVTTDMLCRGFPGTLLVINIRGSQNLYKKCYFSKISWISLLFRARQKLTVRRQAWLWLPKAIISWAIFPKRIFLWQRIRLGCCRCPRWASTSRWDDGWQGQVQWIRCNLHRCRSRESTDIAWRIFHGVSKWCRRSWSCCECRQSCNAYCSKWGTRMSMKPGARCEVSYCHTVQDPIAYIASIAFILLYTAARLWYS